MRAVLERLRQDGLDQVAARVWEAYRTAAADAAPAAKAPDAADKPPPTHVDLMVKLEHVPASRLLRLPLTATLEDLHTLIQVAFDWDDDHLFAFGFQRRSGRQLPEFLFGSPGPELADAGAVTLSDLKLSRRQKFWYLFDFGDSHLFTLSVVELGTREGDRQGHVLRAHGESPEQYPSDDNDEDADDDLPW